MRTRMPGGVGGGAGNDPAYPITGAVESATALHEQACAALEANPARYVWSS